MIRIATLIALVAGLWGCGADEQPSTDKPATGPLVVYTRGGGIAHQPQRLVVERSGHARLEVRTGTTLDRREFDLTAAELDRLEDALDEARGAHAPEITPGCADCFEYAVKADHVQINLDSVSFSDAETPAELKAVVAQLEGLAGR